MAKRVAHGQYRRYRVRRAFANLTNDGTRSEPAATTRYADDWRRCYAVLVIRACSWRRLRRPPANRTSPPFLTAWPTDRRREASMIPVSTLPRQSLGKGDCQCRWPNRQVSSRIDRATSPEWFPTPSSRQAPRPRSARPPSRAQRRQRVGAHAVSTCGSSSSNGRRRSPNRAWARRRPPWAAKSGASIRSSGVMSTLTAMKSRIARSQARWASV